MVNVPVSSSLNFVGSVPFGYFSGEGESESGIGNIYVGIQSRNQIEDNTGLCFSLGFFLPTTSENDDMVNFLSIFTNCYETHKYFPNTLTFYGNFTYNKKSAKGILFGLDVRYLSIRLEVDEEKKRRSEFYRKFRANGGTCILFVNVVDSVSDSLSDRFPSTEYLENSAAF